MITSPFDGGILSGMTEDVNAARPLTEFVLVSWSVCVVAVEAILAFAIRWLWTTHTDRERVSRMNGRPSLCCAERLAVCVRSCFAIPQEVRLLNDLTSRLSITFVICFRPFD